jgi:hypothetical protein
MGSSAQSSSGVHWCRRRVRFNEVPEKVPKVSEGSREGLGGRSQVQQGSAEYSGEGSRKPWCKAKSGSTGSGEGEGHLTHGNLAEVFPALDFPARFRKIYKN